MKSYYLPDLNNDAITGLCRRTGTNLEEVFEIVKPVIESVRKEGDRAVTRYSKKFDGFEPDPLVVNPDDMKSQLDSEAKDAIDTAYRNIHAFHEAQITDPVEVETMPGVACKRISRAIERVGLYVPGGTATLPSTMLMLGIPAAIAGCREIVIATPPRAEGGVSEEILYIARKIGASLIVNAGGAQAIAALACGTETIPKIDKLLGPGNQYVTAAKMLVRNFERGPSIDMPAGPSEVLVIADHQADPALVAADLLSQAEHGIDSQAVLAATRDFDFDTLETELNDQLASLPRKEIARQAIENNSFAVITDTVRQAVDFSNRYAPEHLILQCKGAAGFIDQINHAGSVFIGPWSPESAGDYASGTNHTLPTNGYARMYGGVSLDSFLKYITIQELSREGLQNIAPAVEKLAEIEQLEAHKRAVTIRLNRK